MPSVNDWAAKAARKIIDDLPPHRGEQPREARIAAIIETLAEPILALLRESRQHTKECATERREWDCDCGADAWNARVDAALLGIDVATADEHNTVMQRTTEVLKQPLSSDILTKAQYNTPGDAIQAGFDRVIAKLDELIAKVERA